MIVFHTATTSSVHFQRCLGCPHRRRFYSCDSTKKLEIDWMLRMHRILSKSWDGQVIADLCVTPLGTPTASVSHHVAHVERILAKYPLKTKLHAYGTNIEGKWDDVSAAIKAVHSELHESGVVRISCNMRWGSRIDKKQSLEDKVRKVEEILHDG